VDTLNEPFATRIRDLERDHFRGVSRSFKYKKIVPRLDTFHIGRIQFATNESIRRLKAELTAAAAQKPQGKRRGRPPGSKNKPKPAAVATIASDAGQRAAT
jgi:hypothetical protein